MVKVAVAGGSGNVARELIEGILAAKRHQIMVLTRNKPDEHKRDGVQWVQADYHNKAALVEVLAGVDVVLSFVLPYSDNEDIAQKTLIDACIAAGVKRFAPSE
ncbi:hypothetical protein GJ744_011301 [Endocarpon pusillum]|uniref:NmrA-like domain-containing protein n=1 Tax=Endocarpon pusillum TaxID=364733 RepID=A0A8H7AXP9_9EURO|nr:hypothetical protein GJ744_011301 [Endocarpon pusillum]